MKTTTELMLSTDNTSPDTATGSIFFIGNATVLIRYAGLTILTDPTFIHRYEQVAIGYGLHATRLTDPAVEIDDLPPLELTVLSHVHGDHFDQVTERKLDKALPIVTTPGAIKELQERGFGATHPLEAWSSLVITKGDARLRITSTPGQHRPPLEVQVAGLKDQVHYLSHGETYLFNVSPSRCNF